MPHLAFKFNRSGRLAATALPAKGATEFGVKWFARQIQSTVLGNSLTVQTARMH